MSNLSNTRREEFQTSEQNNKSSNFQILHDPNRLPSTVRVDTNDSMKMSSLTEFDPRQQTPSHSNNSSMNEEPDSRNSFMDKTPFLKFTSVKI